MRVPLFGSCCGGVSELGEVVNEADESPFEANLVEPAQAELPEAARLFDLSEHRLDHLLAQPVSAAPSGAPDLSRHDGNQANWLGLAGAGSCGTMLLPAGGDIAGDAAPGELGEVLVRAVAGIGRSFLRQAAGIGLDGVEQGRELVLIARRIAERAGNDDLVVGIDRGLGIVALDEAVLGAQDAAVRVGEVALRLILGERVLGWLLARRGGAPPSSPSRGSPARCRASASSAALAARIFASRCALSATQSGISSPRRAAPCWRSSALSACAACASQRCTSPASAASFVVIRP